MSNTAKEKNNVVVLGGREFKRVKNGLDEAQLASFIDEIIKERDELIQSQEHVASLNKLAEMTVVEADKLAAQIKAEAEEQAKAESTVIIDKARQQAQQISETKIAEAVEIANEKANAIRAKAEEDAELLLENQKNKIRSELRNIVNQQFGYMLEELEGLKKQAEAVQADFGNKLSEPREEDSDVTMETEKESNPTTAEIAAESDAIVAEKRDSIAAEFANKLDSAAAESDAIVAEKRDSIAAEIAESKPTTSDIADELDSTAAEIAKESNAFDKHPEPSPAMEHMEMNSELSNLLDFEEQPDLGKPQWEMEILPPFDIAKIMEVVSFLDQLPEVVNTEMIVPQIDTPSVLVFLNKSINFVEVLRTIPAVAHVEEVTTDKAATNGESGKGPRKVRIGLSGNKMPQEKK